MLIYDWPPNSVSAIKPGSLFLTYTPVNKVSALPPTYENADSSLLLTSGSSAMSGVTTRRSTPVEEDPAGLGQGEDLKHPW